MHSWMAVIMLRVEKMCATTRVSRRWAARCLEVSEECPSPDCDDEGMERRTIRDEWNAPLQVDFFFRLRSTCTIFYDLIPRHSLWTFASILVVFPGSILQPLISYFFTASNFCLGYVCLPSLPNYRCCCQAVPFWKPTYKLSDDFSSCLIGFM